MGWREGSLDAVLVPLGLLVMVCYHGQLFFRVLKYPNSTVIGVNHSNRRAWVQAIMQDGMKNGILAVQTLRNNIMASTAMATVAITLCSIIAVLVSNSSSSSDHASSTSSLLVGNKSSLVASIKLLSVLVCFLLAFLCNVQSIRYYSHVSFLITIPVETPGFTIDYTHRSLQRGSDFWSLGLRAFYFSFPLFLWIFGPIPMFACAVIMVTLLHFLDTAKDFKGILNDPAYSSTSHSMDSFKIESRAD